MKLYKYLASENALKNIVEGKIKFATLESLNDPTELLPKIYESELLKSLKEKRVNGYSKDDILDLKKQEILFRKLSPETMVISAPESIEKANSIVNLSIYDDINYLTCMFNKTVELMSSRCGIFCTSTRYDSLPMWAHYANNASGYVIEIKNLQKEYSGDGTGILNQINKVEYKKKRSGISFEKGSYNSLFFEKNKDWKYESEKRIITELNDCKKLTIDNGEIYIKKVSKNLISKVIFGWKTSEEKIEILTKEIYAINSNIKVMKAIIRNGLIEIKNL
ncbi:DUF2971 domain-containing protein [Reichenbachiella sp. MALMAid0571]|uniref:DUF2971 domain-containing protein n=1 Tax=Reichenbachiella sp. MALMAid0571 TaxID=3143939 RepID=UPI0032E05648